MSHPMGPVDNATLDAMPRDVEHHDVGHHDVDERQLQLLIKDWRRGRATRNLRQAISDGYVAVFTVVLLAAMLINVVISAQHQAAGCAGAACTSGRSLLPWAALSGVLAVVLIASRMFGPVLASAAEGFWLLDAPIRRGRLLVRRMLLALGAALLVGVLVGALVAALTGSAVSMVLLWAGATGCIAMGATAFAALEQTNERTVLVRLVQTLATLAGIGVLVLVVSTAAGWHTFTLTLATSRGIALAVAAAGLLLTVVCGMLARVRLDRIRRARLTSGGSLMSGMQGAMFALDFGLMRDIVVERDAVARGHVRPTRGRSTGLQALVWRDVQRLVRFPKPLLGLALSLVVPYAVQALGLGSLNVFISALVLLAALVPMFNSLRVLARTNGLARCLPFTTGQIRSAAAVVPTCLAVLWALAATPAFVGVGHTAHHGVVQGLLSALVCGAAGLVGAFRWVSAKSPNFGAPMIATSVGALPPGMMINLMRGFDMVALISLPLVLHAPAWVSLAIAVIAFLVLRTGGITSESLTEMQEENQRRLDEAKTTGSRDGASGQRTRIERRR